ncbi:NAD(P)H-dependent oxidoreductase [Bacteroides sp. NSJ-21]|uniref:NAD(P)H-dependent oxidoreductase n=1 Tax=Bacteroides parvus TaxID=2763025 RepID=A0ABR7C5G3_9BACE|nr:flavodoxin [Bacteroides parvus]MBC5592847.1 NAD(P)H-dependent oxidoreductase [Bacteroides parvus]
MNIIKFLLPAFLAVLVACTSGNAEEKIRNNDTTINTNRTLIVYFSWSGNTRTVANIIHELTSSDIMEIESEEPYPDVYNEVVARFQNERDNNILPALRTQVENMDAYDTLIVGTPIWGGLLSPPVKSFLAGYDLSGKKILPFCTHGGSGTAQSVDNIREVCPDSEILQPLAVYGSRAENSRNEVEEWLAEIGLIKD